jgi:hypothetical protein
MRLASPADDSGHAPPGGAHRDVAPDRRGKDASSGGAGEEAIKGEAWSRALTPPRYSLRLVTARANPKARYRHLHKAVCNNRGS